MDELDCLIVQVNSLVRSVDFVHGSVKEIKEESIKLKSDSEKLNKTNKDLTSKVTDLQARIMCDNLMFFNIKKEEGEYPEQLLKEFRREELKTTREIEFARVHRTGRKGGRARPRPIVAIFERCKDREDVKLTGWKLLKFVEEARVNALTTGTEEGTPLISGHQMNPKFANIGIGEQKKRADANI